MQAVSRILFLAVLLTVPTSAGAQASPGPPFEPPVKTTKVEVAVGLTVNSLSVDLNAQPHCRIASRPCTNDRPNRFGGFGLDATVAVNQSDRHAFVVAAHVHTHVWDATTREYGGNATRTLLMGPRIQSDWIVIPGFSRDSSRFFANALAGVGDSTGTGMQSVVQLGGGVDGIVRRRGRYSYGPPLDVTLRLSIDYRIPLGRQSDVRGWQFGFGLVLGPAFARR